MKCPYCDKEMELGYIQCRDGIHWTPKPQPIAALSFLGKGSISLDNGADDSEKAVFAHLCRPCRKVIIDCAVETPEER